MRLPIQNLDCKTTSQVQWENYVLATQGFSKGTVSHTPRAEPVLGVLFTHFLVHYQQITDL